VLEAGGLLVPLLPQALSAETDSRHAAATKQCFMVMATPSANKQFKDLRRKLPHSSERPRPMRTAKA
jgi:hypothetical protein